MMSYIIKRSAIDFVLGPASCCRQVTASGSSISGSSTPQILSKRVYSNMPEIVDYDYVVKAKDNPDVLVVDVREPNEISSTGSIPNSVNIPLGTVEEAFKKAPGTFKSDFKIDKPENSSEIIFYCHAGKRAANAANKALGLGFTNSKVYGGSWSDWASRQS